MGHEGKCDNEPDGDEERNTSIHWIGCWTGTVPVLMWSCREFNFHRSACSQVTLLTELTRLRYLQRTRKETSCHERDSNPCSHYVSGQRD